MRDAIGGSRDPHIGQLLAQAYREVAAGNLAEDDVVALEERAATVRGRHKLVPQSRPEPGKRTSVGSRPITPESIERRRKLQAESWITPELVGKFTCGERAILTVMAIEQVREGACRLYKGRIAAWAGVCKDLVRKTLRKAQDLCLITCRHSRRSYCSSEPNLVTFIHPAQVRWMEMRAKKRKKRAGAERRAAYEAQRTEWDRVKEARKVAQARKVKAWEAQKARVAAQYESSLSAAERRGRGPTVVVSTSESFLQKESSPVASQPTRENCPSGSFFSSDGIFDAVQRIAQGFVMNRPEENWT